MINVEDHDMPEGSLYQLASDGHVRMVRTVYLSGIQQGVTEACMRDAREASADELLTMITDTIRFSPVVQHYVTQCDRWLTLAARPEGTYERMPATFEARWISQEDILDCTAAGNAKRI